MSLSSSGARPDLHSFPTRRSSDLKAHAERRDGEGRLPVFHVFLGRQERWFHTRPELDKFLETEEAAAGKELAVSEGPQHPRSEEHTSELQSRLQLVCRLLLEQKNL